MSNKGLREDIRQMVERLYALCDYNDRLVMENQRCESPQAKIHVFEKENKQLKEENRTLRNRLEDEDPPEALYRCLLRKIEARFFSDEQAARKSVDEHQPEITGARYSALHSAVTEVYGHTAAMGIIGMGKDSLPVKMLGQLEGLYEVLSDLIDEHPIAAGKCFELRGTLDKLFDK